MKKNEILQEQSLRKFPNLLCSVSKHLSNCFMVPQQKETPNSSIY